MANRLITENIWREITRSAMKASGKSFVAVAYFSKDAAERLPLKAGSMLVVDASERIVGCGLTKPEELIKLYKKGVEIYSFTDLHAKVFVLGNKLFIGSTNVSDSSENDLQEAVIESTDKKLRIASKKFINGLCTIDNSLGIQRLKQLQKLYRPPRYFGGRSRGKNFKKTPQNSNYVFKLKYLDDYSKGYETPLKQGTKEAKKVMNNVKQHSLDEFEWIGKIKVKPGDLITQVISDKNKKWIFPPGRVLTIKKWNAGKNMFIFLELPNKKEILLSKLPKEYGRFVFNRSGKKGKLTAKKIYELWS